MSKPRQDQIAFRQQINKLPGHHRQLLAVRQGVSDITLKLLLRAEGMDLLLAAEQVEETVEYVGLLPEEPEDTQVYVEQRTMTKLYFPVAGYRSLPAIGFN